MKAAVVRAFGEPLVIEDRPIPGPGPGQVAVRMEASGLCHTDIHAAHGDWPVTPTPPFVPGHEGVGIVYSVGEGVTSTQPGQRVAVPWLGYACGTCEHCLTGWETLCLKQQNTGYSVDGCFAEYFTADAAFAAPVPDGIDPIDAAPLTCAGVTTYKAVKVGNVRPGDLVAISGIGGLGHLALQYAEDLRRHGGRDRHHRRETAAGQGSRAPTWSSTPAPRTRPRSCRLTAARASPSGWPWTTSRSPPPMRACGEAAGSCWWPFPPPGTLQIPVFDTVLNGTSVIGSIVGTRADLATVFALHRAGRTRVVTETRPLEDVNDAIDEVLHGKAKARIVLQP